MYKVKNNQLPESLSSMFRINRNETYRLRSNYIGYMLPKPKNEFYEKKYNLFICKSIEQSSKCGKTGKYLYLKY